MISIPDSGFYVYTLARPDGTVFYVGKGQGKRIHKHEIEARAGVRSHKCNTIRQIWVQGGQVQKQIVFTTEDELTALAYEKTLIDQYGLDNLTNLTEGGRGVIGYQFPPEVRAKISATNKGRKPTPLANQHVSEALQGHPVSPETRAKIGAKARARATTPEGQAQLRANVERARTPEARAKIAAAAKARFTDPTARARHLASHQVFTPEQIAEIRARRAAGAVLTSLARAYGCGTSTIGRIVRGQTYFYD